MGVIGALGDVATSLGRELFGFLIRSDPKIAELAGRSGVTMDTLEAAPPEALSAILERAARSGAIDPRDANNITIQIAKDAQEAVPDNVASFADAQSDQMVSKIKGVLENMPYTMNLPYEIGQKLNSEGRLPLPIGTNMMPPSGKGRPEDVYKISGYKADPNNPDIYGYEITSREDDVSYIGVSDPKMGIKEKRPDMVAGWKAALGPQGSERLDYTPPDWQRTETPRIVRTPEDQNAIDQEYNDLFGALPTAPAMPTLKIDNPGGDWLQSKLRRALETREGARPNTYQSTLGSGEGVTGYFRGPLALNPNMLADIPGSLGEELFRPDPVKIDRLRRSIAEEGYDELSGTVLIQVREDGVPFVVEGNHRIIEGIESGRPTIPVEIKYLRGAEDVDGPLSPAALGVPR